MAYNVTEIIQLLYAHGVRSNLAELAAIAMRESGRRPDAFNGNTGTGDESYGLFQINMLGNLGTQRDALFRQIPGYTGKQSLKDPNINVEAMKLISANGTNLNAWGGYKGVSNTHNTNLPAAQSALAGLQASGQINVPPPGVSATGGAGGGGGILGTIGNVAGAIAGGGVTGPIGALAGNTLNPFSAIKDTAGILAGFFGALTNPELWKRVGIGALGLFLLIVAVFLLTDLDVKDVADTAKSAANSAGTAAAAGA